MMTRKQFLRSALGVSAGVLGLTVLGCTSTTPSPDSGAMAGNCVQNGTTVQIGANHGHVLVVTKDDVLAAADKTYDIRGSADHTHAVAITAAMFQQLAANHAIMTESSVDVGHSHPIMVACA